MPALEWVVGMEIVGIPYLPAVGCQIGSKANVHARKLSLQVDHVRVQIMMNHPGRPSNQACIAKPERRLSITANFGEYSAAPLISGLEVLPFVTDTRNL